MSRNRMCYIILALSIIFFLSSVCTYAVLAVTKEESVVPQKVKQMNNSPRMEQRKIIRRLKRIENRMEKREKTRNEQ